MNKKLPEDRVWPVEHYNEKIALAVKACLVQTPWLTYDESQLRASIKRGYEWLKDCTPKQDETLGTIIRCTCRSLIYQGLIVKVKNKLTTTQTWQWRKGAEDPDASSTIITGDEVVVTSQKSKDFLKKHGCVDRSQLKKLLDEKD
jgi:hypothetical protein